MDLDELTQRYGTPPSVVNNGHIYQIFKDSVNIHSNTPATWLCMWLNKDVSEADLVVLRLRMKRIAQKCGQLRGQKREHFLSEVFHLPTANMKPVSTTASTSTQETVDSSTQTVPEPDYRKRLNELIAEIHTKETTLNKILKKIDDAKNCMIDLDNESRYFKRRNVRTREARFKATIQNQRRTNIILRRQVKEKNQGVDGFERNVLVKEQKMKSHYKIKAEKRKEEIKKLRSKLREVKKESASAREENLFCDGDDTNYEGDYFGDDVRLCVYDLLGLEVGIEKVSPVIRAVAQRLFNRNISPLPSRQTVLRMADEAHYLAKKYFAHRLQSSQNFGIKKDGTSRQKVNIMDTSLTLEDGEVLPLGFKRVARETAQAITSVTIAQFAELQEASTKKDEWAKEVLSKVSFIMTDRAANEKLSNKQLDDWIQRELKASTLPSTKIHSMYCMIHVLLGFQREIIQEVNEAQKVMEVEGGKLGRDNSSSFAAWRFQNVASRLIKNGCDILGPNGDEKCGMRSKWLADCRMRNLKSFVGDFRDNRFNGVFECAAQLLHHIDDILALEKRLPKDINLKVKSVMLDLKDSRAVTVLQAYALFFFKVTEPYRLAIMSRNVVYLNLGHTIQMMMDSLQEVESNPACLLEDNFSLFAEDQDSTCVSHPLYETASKIRHPDRQELLLMLLGRMAKACVKTISNQLGEFVGGHLAKEAAAIEVDRTKGAGADNLTSERHFGSLDSSMKRRRHSTLHHHSTILMLKSKRSSILAWLDDLPPQERAQTLKLARKEGKRLREKHRKEVAAEKEKEELALLDTEKKVNRGKKRSAAGEEQGPSRRHNASSPPVPSLPGPNELALGQWVAVAYENGWFPGTITSKSDDSIEIDFMHPTTDGKFSWPTRKDCVILDHQFVFWIMRVSPVPVSGGRFFVLDKEELKAIVSSFKAYKDHFF